MALVVEDGTIVVGANSYVTIETARAYATSRGLSLSAIDSVVEAQLVLAMDYLESLRSKYKGAKTDVVTPQALQWPRSEVVIDGEDFGANSIPQELQDAQCRLAIEQEAGIELFPSQGEEGKFIVREKIGPLSTEYSEKVVGRIQPVLTAVSSLLAPLLKEGGLSLKAIRI
jgi:hypothetical protein